jgi:tetratricopeptide (TPR) repeat protein
MTGPRFFLLAIFGGGLVAHAPSAQAHHGPTKAIEALSERIDHGEKSADLVARRGDEYRALGDLKSAALDYNAALELDARWLPALYGLAHVCVKRQQFQEAELAAERGIATAADAEEAAPFHALIAGIHQECGRWDDALRCWESALESSRPDVDWFLGKAQVLGSRTVQRRPKSFSSLRWNETPARC